jgi:erythromycin esterase-like protein
MSWQIEPPILDTVEEAAMPLHGGDEDYDALLELIGHRRVVLLGEASHGTHEFYRERAEITRRLIEEKGFCAVAVEADWPDAYRVNEFVRCRSTDATAVEALGGFQRFPTWMWRNSDVLDFSGWLRERNEMRPEEARVGFYGLDLYSLHASIQAVLDYLDAVDPAAAERARERYGCFDHFGEDSQAYGYAAGLGLSPSCEHDVVEQLVELRRRAADYARMDGRIPPDAFFFAEQNARLVKNAEEYYRSMFRGRVASWNLRDQHMGETLERLRRHLEQEGRQPAKLVVWAHNSHLGDARATEMGQQGEWNLGQLARERYGSQTALVGFSTHSGTVTAAAGWGGEAERKQVRPGLPGSFEDLFHQVAQRGLPRFLLNLRDAAGVRRCLSDWRLQRAIGVIYAPHTERQSHYFHVRLQEQFDALLHFDRTRAVEPLERTGRWEGADLPETYPSGL